MNKEKLICIDISTGPYGQFVETLLSMSDGRSSYTCVANVHMLVEAYQDPAFAEIVNGADVVTPDGVPLTWGLRLVKHKRQDRVAGMDLLPDLLSAATRKKIPVYFYGSTVALLDKLRDFIAVNYPGFITAGMYSPPFRPLDATEEEAIVKMINESGAKLVFVVLGCPKQEKWMASMKGRIHAAMVGVGGALPVLIGIQKRAPRWMQRTGLEWLHRLGQEPRRLFKRYFVTNSVYMYLLLKAWMRGIFVRGNRSATATGTDI